VKKIAFFDFDGTITKKDSLLEVIKYQKGTPAFFRGFLLNVPYLIALKLNLITNQAAKEKILTYFFGGIPLSSFQSACDDFIDDKFESILRPGALTAVKNLQESGFEVVIVTASVENWIKKWSDHLDVGLVGSVLEIKNNLVTGKLTGKNCHGEEKAVRIKARYDLSCFDEIYCYGDSGGDKQMLALATKAFYKPFRD
jgi:phosphatidylglycerophosphatase C